MAATVTAGLIFWLRPGWISLPPPPTGLSGGTRPRLAIPGHPAPPIARTPSDLAITVATEARIAFHDAEQLTIFRLADNPRILVLDYPTLRQQGLALNRIAAFVEKASLPKDRVLDDPTLAAEIARSGETTESYYYGHDYAVDDLFRFFAAADRDKIRLSEQEEFLRRLINRERQAAPTNHSAIITVVRTAPASIDTLTRRVILRHELSHGEFFTNPAYAAFVRRAWSDLLSPSDRRAFLRFLEAQNYDTTNLSLVVNEMQAFLMFTPDERYISAERLGLTPTALRRLREAFLAGMPAGWLRTLATTPLP